MSVTDWLTPCWKNLFRHGKASAALIIPAALDDAGFYAGEFRVLAHLSRRVGKNGRYWPSAGGIAKHCLMTKKIVIKHLQVLEARGAIEATRDEHPREVKVKKCRNGMRGDAIGYAFKGETFTFTEDKSLVFTL